MKKKVVIIGAGPAGLTAGYYLLKSSKDYEVTILESSNQVGGISKTINYDGNRMDLGGHRFFTKDDRVNEIWQELMKVQGTGSYDDIKLDTKKEFCLDGPNPEKEDNVFLVRNRVSRIYYKKKFFDYPVNLSFNTIKNLGFIQTMESGFSYLKSTIVKKDETNLENFYINRFGKKLYNIFFKGYTEKLWGRSPEFIDSSWGSQRVKGISIKEVLKDYFCKVFKINNKNKQTSLIESFNYPKYGPGQMYEEMEKQIIKNGGTILKEHEVIKINNKNNKIESVICLNNNKKKEIKGDIFISSMPIKDLINGMNSVPKKVNYIATNLPYRDFITIGLILNNLKIKNKTKIKTLNNNIPDCWIYVQSTDVKLGRIQVFNNWSPYLVKDIDNTISLGLEYFCNENDEFWNKTNDELLEFATNELIKMGIIESKDNILNYHVEKVKKAYPAYFDTYKDFNIVKKYLDKYTNLYCIGRNGQHRYNNMDHSMECAITCIDNILNNKKDKSNIWNINAEREYHEKK